MVNLVKRESIGKERLEPISSYFPESIVFLSSREAPGACFGGEHRAAAVDDDDHPMMMPRSQCVDTLPAQNWCQIWSKGTCKAVTPTITFESDLGAQKFAYSVRQEVSE